MVFVIPPSRFTFQHKPEAYVPHAISVPAGLLSAFLMAYSKGKFKSNCDKRLIV
jgi:hypothetical protein